MKTISFRLTIGEKENINKIKKAFNCPSKGAAIRLAINTINEMVNTLNNSKKKPGRPIKM